MILAYTLWALGLLALLASSVLPVGTTSSKLAQATLASAQSDALVEGLVNMAIFALLDPRPEHRWRTDGTVHDVRFEGARAEIVVHDEIGRIDLNQAGAPLLSGLFQSAGVSQEDSSTLVERVLIWRDARAAANAGSSQPIEGSHVEPRLGPFQSTDELRLVPGITDALFKRISPAITVYSGKPSVDPRFAPREVLDALRINDPEGVKAYEQTGAIAQSAAPMVPIEGRAFRIRAKLKFLNSDRNAEVIVRLTNNPKRPFWVLDWQTR
jgi:general secretion pathway protein K